MTPHRRRCLTKAILEIKGALSVTDAWGKVTLITSEKLLLMSDDDLSTLFEEIERSLDSASITEPMPKPAIETVETIVMEAVVPKKKD